VLSEFPFEEHVHLREVSTAEAHSLRNQGTSRAEATLK